MRRDLFIEHGIYVTIKYKISDQFKLNGTLGWHMHAVRFQSAQTVQL